MNPAEYAARYVHNRHSVYSVSHAPGGLAAGVCTACRQNVYATRRRGRFSPDWGWHLYTITIQEQP